MSRTFSHAPTNVRHRNAPDATFEHYCCAHDPDQPGATRAVYTTETMTLPPRLEYVERFYITDPPSGYPVRRGHRVDSRGIPYGPPGYFVTIPTVRPAEQQTFRRHIGDDPAPCTPGLCGWKSAEVFRTIKGDTPASERARIKRVRRTERATTRALLRRAAAEYNDHGDTEIEDTPLRAADWAWWD